MKNTILFFSLVGLFLFATPSQAQDFKSAIGARLGYPISASFKTFLNESNAIEVYAGTRGFGNSLSSYRWYIVSGAYQIHKPIESVERLQYYFGAGASVLFWSFDFDTSESTTTFGLQGYLGLSYTLENSPVNFSVDWIPTFFVNGFGNGFGAGYGSLAVRYTFGSGE